MTCTSHTLRILFVAALAIISIASMQVACEDEDTCESAGPAAATSSALLQTKKSTDGIKIQTVEQSIVPLSPAHIAESHDCIAASLQEAHLSAIRYHASLLAAGTREAVKQSPITRSTGACAGKSPGNDCTMTMNQYPVQGACTAYGMDQQLHCEIGQFGACADTPQGSTSHTCNVYGMSGVCQPVTGYPKSDPYLPATIVTVYGCDMAQESTLDTSQLPGATPTPTQPPGPQPQTGVSNTGASASLDAAGFKTVTSLCCAPEMEFFFNRLLASMGLQVCSKPHIQGLMHWFTCVPDMDFRYMIDVINNGNPCKYWAAKGAVCPALTPQCQGNWCR